jgi:hypothetical protein
VALIPSMLAGSSVANSGMPSRDSSFSIFSALKVSLAERSMSSQTTAANLGSGALASVSRSARPDLGGGVGRGFASRAVRRVTRGGECIRRAER